MKLLKFGAKWCGICRVLNKNLENFSGCEVVKYDVDEIDEDLLQKYNIRNIPVSILVNDEGEEIKRWVGLFNVNEITDFFKGENA